MFRRFKYGLIDLYTDRRTLPKFDMLYHALQWNSYDELLNIQNSKLKNLIKFVYSHNKYYRKVFNNLNLKPEDITSVEDLRNLPVLNKKVIRENYEEMKSNGYEQFKPRVRATSGSTGEALHFILDRETHSWAHAYMLLAWYTTGYRLGDKIVVISSGSSKTKSDISQKVFSFLRNSVDLSSFDVDECEILRYINVINKNRPVLLYGYSSALALLSKYIIDKKVSVHSPKGIVTTGENLLPHNRERIEKAFNAKVFDQYGVLESGVTAYECENHDGYHIGMTKGVVEILNDKNVNVLNETGNIISTDLDNYAFPIIRYDTGDIGSKTNRKCPCGRGFELLSSLEGRSREFITAKNGKKIHGAIFSYIVRENPWINQYQIYQKTPGEIYVKLLMDGELSSDKIDSVKNYFNKTTSDSFDIIIEKVDNIPLSANNKRHFVISEISNI
jgi:phenylacetate-CoA ligase